MENISLGELSKKTGRAKGPLISSLFLIFVTLITGGFLVYLYSIFGSRSQTGGVRFEGDIKILLYAALLCFALTLLGVVFYFIGKPAWTFTFYQNGLIRKGKSGGTDIDYYQDIETAYVFLDVYGFMSAIIYRKINENEWIIINNRNQRAAFNAFLEPYTQHKTIELWPEIENGGEVSFCQLNKISMLKEKYLGIGKVANILKGEKTEIKLSQNYLTIDTLSIPVSTIKKINFHFWSGDLELFDELGQKIHSFPNSYISNEGIFANLIQILVNKNSPVS